MTTATAAPADRPTVLTPMTTSVTALKDKGTLVDGSADL